MIFFQNTFIDEMISVADLVTFSLDLETFGTSAASYTGGGMHMSYGVLKILQGDRRKSRQ